MSVKGAFLERLRATSARERAFLGVCALFVATFVVGKWAILPARAEYLRTRAAIPERLATIARYEALRQGQDRIDGELYVQLQRLERLEEGLLEGDTPAAAGIYLQGLLKPLTLRPETRMTSIRALPPARKGAYVEVAVQMEVQTSTEGLALLLAEIGRQPKVLRVRKLTANNSGVYTSTVQRKEVINLSMVVSGLAASPFEEKTPVSGGEE